MSDARSRFAQVALGQVVVVVVEALLQLALDYPLEEEESRWSVAARIRGETK